MQSPTAAQLRYLRGLAEATGTTFTPPRTRAQASREIDRLRSRRRLSASEQYLERRTLEDITGPDDAVRFRASETSGYGANARPEERR